MTSSNTEQRLSPEERFAQRRRATRRTLLLMLLALLLLALFQWRLTAFKQNHQEKQRLADSIWHADSVHRADSLERLRKLLEAASLSGADSLRVADSLRGVDSLHRADSLRLADSLLLAKRKGHASGAFVDEDSLRKARRADSLRVADSLRNEAARAARRAADSLPPAADLIPPPGRYYQGISLRAHCSEPKCKTEISLGDSTHSQDGAAAQVYNKSGVVYYRAIDSLGNSGSWQAGIYDMASDNRCGANAFPVPVQGKQVCVDAYEYPNQPDQKPKDMVTQEMAARLCSDAGKRLCSVNEWQAACKGKDNLKYPYGTRYDQTKCVTDSKEAKRSGRAELCRSWWGMYDMAGNLWEWTATPAPQRSSMFLVAGGSWNTQNASQCGETKFSFYPQNEYPFVGFRCCSDAR